MGRDADTSTFDNEYLPLRAITWRPKTRRGYLADLVQGKSGVVVTVKRRSTQCRRGQNAVVPPLIPDAVTALSGRLAAIVVCDRHVFTRHIGSRIEFRHVVSLVLPVAVFFSAPPAENMAVATPKVGFLGCGSIARAMAMSMIQGFVTPGDHIFGYDVDAKSSELMAELGANVQDNAKAVAEAADVIIVAMAPTAARAAVKEIASVLRGDEEKIIVSLAAGVTIAAIQQVMHTLLLLRLLLLCYLIAPFAVPHGCVSSSCCRRLFPRRRCCACCPTCRALCAKGRVPLLPVRALHLPTLQKWWISWHPLGLVWKSRSCISLSLCFHMNRRHR